MATFDYNPITGQLDLVGAGGGTSYIDGDVEYHSNLAVTVNSPAVNSAFLVRKGEGVYFISRKPAGIWVRELNNGNLDDWKYAGTFSDLYRDANFRILNNADVSKELAFDVSGITTGTTRTLTVPDASGTIALTTTAPAAHAASHAAAGSDPVILSQLDSQPVEQINKFKLGLGGDSPTGRFVGVSTADDPLIGIFSYADEETYDPDDEVASSAFGVTLGATNTNLFAQYLQSGELTAQYNFPAVSGTLALTSDIPTTFAASAITSGTLDNARINFAAPAAIGSTTGAAGTFTTLAATDSSLTFGAGTASSPTVKFAGSNVGIYQRASAELTLTDGNEPQARYFANAIVVNSDFSIQWGNSTTAPTGGDTVLRRDAAGVLAQYNSTNAQTFRIYNTFTSTTNFERLNIIAQSAGSVIIGTEKGSTGGTARALELQTDGVTRMTVAAAGAVSTSGNFSCVDLTASTLTVTSGSVTAAATGALRWSGRARFNSPADSIVTIVNAANTDFDRLQFGGTTSSFPALKRSSTVLQARLADDSGYTTMDALHRLQGTAPATTGATGTAGDIRYDADYIYVCTATNTWKRAAIATW